MVPNNILMISCKKMVVTFSGIILILVMAGCGGGGSGKGSLRVTIEPAGAVSAGAQWRVSGGSWQDSGDTQSSLKVGNHTVEFSEISSWHEPDNLSVTISKNETTTAIGTYDTGGETITVTGMVDDGTSKSPISWAKCDFVDLNGAIHYSDTAVNNGIYEFPNVHPAMEGFIRCNPLAISKLQLTTFLNVESFPDENLISGEDVSPTTTVVADIIDSESPADPMARRKDLFDAIENGDAHLKALVNAKRVLFNRMLRKKIDAFFGGGPGADLGGEVGGDTGDGADFSPIANASCDFALELEGEVLYYDPLEDLRDGKLDRPDLAAIKDEVEEELKNILPQIKEAIKNKFPGGVGDPISGIADDDGTYSLPIPLNIQGFVRCAPPGLPNLKLATLVRKLEKAQKLENQDVKPDTTFFSHSIATKLSDDLENVKENYLTDIKGLGDVQILKDGEEISGFELKGEPRDDDVGLVAFSATSLFNILYKNKEDVNYFEALDGLIDNQEVRSEDLKYLGVSEENAEKYSEVVNASNKVAGVELDTDLASALKKTRIKVTVIDRHEDDITPVMGAEVNITNAPNDIGCECDLPVTTDSDGKVILTLTGVTTDATEITVEASKFPDFNTKSAKIKIVAFATVDFEIVLTPIGDSYTNSLGMTFRAINAGTFTMGSPLSEPGRNSDETQHQVTLTRPFYMQTTEVTQSQWADVMGSNPSSDKTCGGDCPVENISWNNIQSFISELNTRGEGIYRLPTEAEWEYAARAGSTTAFANGGITELSCGQDPNLDAMGWYCYNSGDRIHPVAQKAANQWGLYDMHGNIWEWTQDWYGPYPSGPVTDPTGPGTATGVSHVGHGGGFRVTAALCRSAKRGQRTTEPYDGPDPYTGFRLVVTP